MENIVQGGNYNKFFRQLLFVAFLILVGLIIFRQLQFFVESLLGAITLYIAFRGVLFRLEDRWKWSPWLAGLALTLVCTVILGGLGYLIVSMIAGQIPSIDTSEIMEGLKGLVVRVNDAVGFSVVNDTTISNAGNLITKLLSGIFNTTYSFASNIFMMLVIVYFMFAAGRRMERQVYRYMPFKGKSLCLLQTEVKNVVFSNAIGIPLIMIAQTIASGIIYRLTGMENYIFWGFLTAICGLIPLIGTALVYIPVAVYFAVTGELWTGVVITLYGMLVISNTDNLIRIILLKQIGDTHPLVVVFGVVLGIPLFGFWGIIFGPLLISGFLLLTKIYYMEYGLIADPDETAEAEDAAEHTPPVKTIHDLHAVKAVKMLRPRSSKKGAGRKNQC